MWKASENGKLLLISCWFVPSNILSLTDLSAQATWHVMCIGLRVRPSYPGARITITRFVNFAIMEIYMSKLSENFKYRWVVEKETSFNDSANLWENGISLHSNPQPRPNDRSFIRVQGFSACTLTLSQCTLAGPVYTGMPLECHWLI